MAVKLSGKWYDMLKWVALVALPAVGVLYAALAPLWGFPLVEQVVGTVAAVDVFLGVLLGISSSQYKKDIGNVTLVPSNKAMVQVEWVLWDNTYEMALWVAQVLLPGLATFYFALALIWQLPEPQKVVTTIMAIDAFLGALIGFSSSQYNKTATFTRIFNSQK